MFTPGTLVHVWPLKGIGLAAARGRVVEDDAVGLTVEYERDDAPTIARIPHSAIARVDNLDAITSRRADRDAEIRRVAAETGRSPAHVLLNRPEVTA